MILIWEEYHFGLHSIHLSCIEGCHSLLYRNSVIHLTVGDKDRSIPSLYELMRGVGVVPNGNRIVVPRRSAVIPFREPHLLCHHIHLLLIEYAGVGDKCREGVVVDACKIIDGITAVTCAHSANLANIRLILHSICRSKVILHILAYIVSRYLLAPRLSERGATPSVRQNGDISLRGHQPEVPPCGETLVQGALRASCTHHNCRINLRLIKICRVEEPYQHLLAICGCHPALLYRRSLQLCQNICILRGNLLKLSACYINGNNLRRTQQGGVGCKQGVGIKQREGAKIEPGRIGSNSPYACAIIVICRNRPCSLIALNLAAKLFIYIHNKNGIAAIDSRGKVDFVRLCAPKQTLYIIFIICRELPLLSGCKIHNKEPQLVCLVAIPLHTEPCNIFAVRGEERIGVVSHHSLGYVRSGAICNIVKVNVCVGREGILLPDKLSAGIGYGALIGRPAELLKTAERQGRKFEEVLFAHNILGICKSPLSGGFAELSHISVRNLLHKVVPMAVHKVIYCSCVCLVHIGIDV